MRWYVQVSLSATAANTPPRFCLFVLLPPSLWVCCSSYAPVLCCHHRFVWVYCSSYAPVFFFSCLVQPPRPPPRYSRKSPRGVAPRFEQRRRRCVLPRSASGSRSTRNCSPTSGEGSSGKKKGDHPTTTTTTTNRSARLLAHYVSFVTAATTKKSHNLRGFVNVGIMCIHHVTFSIIQNHLF